MTYTTEFPDYDNASEAEMLLSAGWRDMSWHNEHCPAFLAGGALLHMDYVNPALREFADGPRYMLDFLDHKGQRTDIPTVEFDSLKAALGALYEGLIGYNPFDDCPLNTEAGISAIIAEYFAERDGEQGQ